MGSSARRRFAAATRWRIFRPSLAFTKRCPIAAGGLGILAGDHAKSASDSGLGFVGISLFYREGYFQQAIDANNWQTEYYTLLNPKNLPVEPVLNDKGEPLVCRVEIGMNRGGLPGLAGERRPRRRSIAGRQSPRKRAAFSRLDSARLWRRQHHADHAGNAAGHRRCSAAARARRAAVGLPHERGPRRLSDARNWSARRWRPERASRRRSSQTKAECIFTTHTPVEAGHDRFSPDLMDYAMHRFRDPDAGAVWRTDEVGPGQSAKRARAVLHDGAGPEAFARRQRGKRTARAHEPADVAVPLSRQTGGAGAHRPHHQRHPLARLDERDGSPFLAAQAGRRLSPRGATVRQARVWTGTRTSTRPPFGNAWPIPNFISDEELWALRYKLRRELIEFARRRLLIQRQRRAGGFHRL